MKRHATKPAGRGSSPACVLVVQARPRTTPCRSSSRINRTTAQRRSRELRGAVTSRPSSVRTPAGVHSTLVEFFPDSAPCLPVGAWCAARDSLFGLMEKVRGRSDRQWRADRLGSVGVPMLVGEVHRQFARRSNSVWPKYADAFRKFSSARLNSPFSRASAFNPVVLVCRETRARAEDHARLGGPSGAGPPPCIRACWPPNAWRPIARGVHGRAPGAIARRGPGVPVSTCLQNEPSDKPGQVQCRSYARISSPRSRRSEVR